MKQIKVKVKYKVQPRTFHESSQAGANLGPGRLGSCLGAVDLKWAASKLSKLLITTTPFHSLTERYLMNVDGNFN